MSGAMDTDRFEIAEQILNVPYWRQSIPVGKGIRTPGRVRTQKWKRLGIEDKVAQNTVLDVGAWDGLLSFRAEDAGAERVVAMDIYNQRGDYGGWWSEIREGSADAGIRTAKQLRGSEVEIWDKDIYDIGPQDGKFDFTLFPAVFYHLRNPLRALEKLQAVTSKTCVIETMVHPETDGIEIDTGEKPPFIVPGRRTLVNFCKLAGFSSIEVVESGFHPFKNTQAIVEPGAKLHRGTNSRELPEWTRVRIVEDGGNYPVEIANDRFYVELMTGEGPTQGWVDEGDIHRGFRALAKGEGIGEAAKHAARKMIRARNSPKLRGITGQRDWIVVHAHY